MNKQTKLDGMPSEPKTIGERREAGHPFTVAVPTEATQGAVYQLGPHRLMCGDSTEREDLAVLLGDTLPDCIMTDPPYSSGGFSGSNQEFAKGSGSRGTTKKHVPLFNDQLSTRGYMKLIKSAILAAVEAQVVYMFCDWRMWPITVDIAEGSGLSVMSIKQTEELETSADYLWYGYSTLVHWKDDDGQFHWIRRGGGNLRFTVLAMLPLVRN